MKRNIIIVTILIFFSSIVSAQIAAGYEVGTWYGFKKVAITYSFDDNTSNQIPVVVPLLNQYNFKATFNPVVNWVGGNWAGWQTLANNGNEIASHTVSHANLNAISVAEQDTECKNAQSTIKTNTGSECVTIAYPNCNIGDLTTLQKYYIAGRICDGATVSNNPSDFYRLGSIICGADGTMKTAQNFNDKVSSAVAAKGWCVFLIHGIDSDGGYSSLSSTEFGSHLSYVNTNATNYWVAPFGTVVKYIKERNALKLVETTITADSLRLVASHTLTSTLTTYNTAITIRRELPSGWTNANVYKNTTKITSTIVTEGGKTYVVFDVIPNDGTMYLAKSTGSTGPTTTFTELLNNGEFDSGTTGWSTYNDGTAQSTLTATTTAALSGTNAIQFCPNATNFGTADWHIQAYQNVTLEANKEYTFTFMAKAASARTITVMFQQVASSYAVYKSFTYNLTTTAQTFTETFTLTGTVDPACKVTFCVGNNASCVSIDKVSLGYTTSGGGTTDPPVGNGQGAFYTDVYTNLFKEVLGKTDAEINTKVTNAFQQIFYGTATQKLYYEVGTDMAYVLDVNNNDVRTEGMSYGMMICVQLNKQAEFNKLWKWAKTYMQYGTSSNYNGYFAWQCNTDGSIKGNGPASDGEAYFITALFFAANRWGNATGIFNYGAEAQDILVKISNKTGAGSVYNLFNANSKLITFVPYGDSYLFTDPSYNLPGFWELWARWSTSNIAFWTQTPEASRKLLRDASHTTSGLSTDYSNFDGTPKEVSYNVDADRFMYDAWRTVMNIGMDYHWFRSDSTNQRAIITKYLTFFKNQGTSYKNHYDWNGANAGGDHSTGLVACNAAACFAVNDNTLRTPFLTEFWNIAIPTGTYRYYDGMLYMLALLHCSGNFKIYKPAVTCTTPAAPTVTTPITYCQGATATALTATGTALKWYTVATGGTSSTTAPTPTTTTAGSTTYYVSQTVSTCESTRAAIVVTVTATPAAPTVTTPVTYCQGVTATALTATGTALKWYTVATGGTGSATAPIPTTTAAGSTTYYVSQTVSTCESARAAIVVTVNAIPAAPTVTSPISYSQGATATALTATGTALKWYTVATGGTGSTTAPTPSTATIGTTNYYVSQTVNGCESPRSQIVVNITIATLTQTLTLDAGWNLISINVVPSDYSIATIFAPILSNVDIVKNADGFYKVGQAANLQSLTQLTLGTSYLVKMKTAQTITVTGTAPGTVTVTLKQGWNMLGYPVSTTKATTTVLSTIWTNTQTIKNFDGFLDHTSGTLNSMIPGEGYFIYMNTSSNLDF